MLSMKNVTLVGATRTPCPPGSTAAGRASYQLIKNCGVVELLQEMFGFKVNYRLFNEREFLSFSYFNGSNGTWVNGIDFYFTHLPLTHSMLNIAYPIHAIEFWRVGFLLRRADFGLFQSFYSNPFSARVWTCLAGSMTLAAILFYVTGRGERWLLGAGECSFVNELVITLAASCQHYLPVRARLTSRRAAYAIYFFFAYLMYLFYSSNLLSHLVSDRDGRLDVDALAASDYRCVVLDKFAPAIAMFIQQNKSWHLSNLVRRKLSPVAAVPAAAAARALRGGRTAVLSDYVALYPLLNTQFSEEAICQLIELDVYKNVQKYFFTSRNFTFKEHFKRGILRATETGVVARIGSAARRAAPACGARRWARLALRHVLQPLLGLAAGAAAAAAVLLFELAQRGRRLYPYAD